MELVEKTEAIRLSFYALSKIHLERFGSFRKILVIQSKSNQSAAHSFMIAIFFRHGFDNNINGNSENVMRNNCHAFKKRGVHSFS